MLIGTAAAGKCLLAVDSLAQGPSSCTLSLDVLKLNSKGYGGGSRAKGVRNELHGICRFPGGAVVLLFGRCEKAARSCAEIPRTDSADLG